jgi:fibronectin-binding autotransporter adhesin
LNISGANNFTLAGGATLTVNAILKSGSNSATIRGGALIQPPANSDLVLRTNQSSDVLTVSTAIATTGANSFSVSGPGTVVLSGANTFGGVALNGGVLNVGSSGALGSSGAISFYGGTLQYSAANTTDYSARFATSDYQPISIDTNSQNVSLATVLTGNGASLTKQGAGTLFVNGANNYTGVTTINGGVLSVNSLGNVNTPSGIGTGSSGGSAGDLVIGNGTLQFIGTLPTSTNRLFTITPPTNGLATIDSSSPSPANTLSFTNPGQIAYPSTDSQYATLALSGSNTGPNTFAPAIGTTTETAHVVKNGSGSWVLTGDESHTGGATVNAGTLTLDANTGKLQGSLYVAPGATFVYQGASTGSSLTFSILDGGGTIASVYGGSGNTVLTFNFISGSPLYTFVASGGINGVNNKIVFGGQPPPGGQFLGFSALFAPALGATPNYAWNDAGNFVRGINYGVDPGAVASSGGASVSGTYVQVNGPVTAEATGSLSTLNINGANDLTLASGAMLTVSGILKTGNNAAIISGGVGIRPPPSIQMNIFTGQPSDTLTVATPILANSGGAVLIGGPGTVILAAANTYTAGTTVNSGTLQLANANAVQAGAVNLGSASNLVFSAGIGTVRFGTLGGAGSFALTDLGGNPVSLVVGTNIQTTYYSGVLSGNGGLTVNGGYMMGLSAINSYSGPTILDHAGIAVNSLANTNTPSGIGRGSVAGSAGDLVFGGGSLVYVSNSPAATDRLFTIGDISGNSATIESDSASPSNTLSFTSTGPIVLVNAAPHTLQLNAGNTGPNLFAPSIGDQSAANPTNLVEGGSGGTWLLRGANTYSGGTNIQGILNVNADAELGAPPAVATLNITFGHAGIVYSQPPTFALQFAANMTLNSNRSAMIVSGITGAFDTQNFNVAYSGTISGAGKFAKQGTGTLTLSGASTYTGGTTISAGTLQLGNGGTVGSLSPGSAITDNGALVINRSNAAVQGADFSSAAITGSGRFIQAGAGTTTLAAANTYAGGTDVQQGILKVANTSGSGTGGGTVTVESGATLGGGFGSSTGATGANLHGGVFDANHVGIISGAVNVVSSGNLAPGNSVGTLTVGGLTVSNGSILDYEFNNTPANDFTVVTNSNGLILNGGLGAGAGFELYAENTTTPFDIPGTYHLIHYVGSIQGSKGVASLLVLDPQPGFSYSFSNSLSLSDVDLTITPVPEPTCLILAMGGILFTLTRFRRRRA